MTRIILILVFFIAKTSMAQEVKSSSYNFMLKQLLKRDVPEVGVEKAAQMEGAVFIDARESAEFEVSHIKNAIWVGYDQQDFSAIEKLDLATELIVYCSVGYRSEKTVYKLNQMGFKNVYNLFGGIFEWVNREKPVYHQNEKTNQVHAYSRVWGVWLSKGEKKYD